MSQIDQLGLQELHIDRDLFLAKLESVHNICVHVGVTIAPNHTKNKLLLRSGVRSRILSLWGTGTHTCSCIVSRRIHSGE